LIAHSQEAKEALENRNLASPANRENHCGVKAPLAVALAYQSFPNQNHLYNNKSERLSPRKTLKNRNFCEPAT
jgi:hypothetical protein